MTAHGYTVLLTSGGRRVALVKEFQAALQRLGVAGRCAACGYDMRATPKRCPECGLEAGHLSE